MISGNPALKTRAKELNEARVSYFTMIKESLQKEDLGALEAFQLSRRGEAEEDEFVKQLTRKWTDDILSQ